MCSICRRDARRQWSCYITLLRDHPPLTASDTIGQTADSGSMLIGKMQPTNPLTRQLMVLHTRGHIKLSHVLGGVGRNATFHDLPFVWVM